MQALAQAMLQQLLNAAAPNMAAPAAPAAVVQFVDPKDSPDPLDRTTRLGSSLYNQSVEPLDIVWDGQAENLAQFANALLLRARQARWDVNTPTGITRITINVAAGPGGAQVPRIYHLLKDYRSISMEMVQNANTSRQNPRAIQNSQAMYECLAASFTGQIKSLIFDQLGNMPEIEDGPILFIRAIQCSQALGMASSITALDKLSDLDPAKYKFDITDINTALFNLMKQSAGLTGKLFPNEAQVTYLLRTYKRIKQPEAWKTWVEARTTDNPPPQAQKLANDAVAYANTLHQEGVWQPKKQTLEAQIQAMLAQHVEKAAGKKRKPDSSDDTGKENNSAKRRKVDGKPKPTDKKSSAPPFLTSRKTKDGKDYKVGDTKSWNGKEYHYCDCPNHKKNSAWHLFSAEQCRTRAKWLKEKKTTKGNEKQPNVEGNVVDVENESEDAAPADDTRGQLMSMMGDLFKQAVDDETRSTVGAAMELLNKL